MARAFHGVEHHSISKTRQPPCQRRTRRSSDSPPSPEVGGAMMRRASETPVGWHACPKRQAWEVATTRTLKRPSEVDHRLFMLPLEGEHATQSSTSPALSARSQCQHRATDSLTVAARYSAHAHVQRCLRAVAQEGGPSSLVGWHACPKWQAWEVAMTKTMARPSEVGHRLDMLPLDGEHATQSSTSPALGARSRCRHRATDSLTVAARYASVTSTCLPLRAGMPPWWHNGYSPMIFTSTRFLRLPSNSP